MRSRCCARDRSSQPDHPSRRRCRGAARRERRSICAFTSTVTDLIAVERAVEDAHRREWARVLAATVRVARDLDLAEECVQDAYAAALVAWTREGIPKNPGAWLTTVAKRRATDAVRREQIFHSKLPMLVEPEASVVEPALEEPMIAEAEDFVPDEPLRLIFMCCHPALAQEAQLALTLRLVCGLSTADIARALLVSETTMAARITRAKKKIYGARIPFRMPRAAELPDRLRSVLGVIHLLFTAGHTAPSGAMLMRADLVDWALHLARMLRALMPDEPEVSGLLALLLVTDARRATRVDASGRLLRLEDQDRSRWDRVALAQVEDLERDSRLSGYQYLPAIKADLLRRLGRADEAAAAYRRALELTANEAEREFLLSRLSGPSSA